MRPPNYSGLSYTFGPGPMTPGVKALVYLNVAAFLVTLIVRRLLLVFGLMPMAVVERGFIWQPVTYLFMHGGLGHILVNMLGLWMFGTELERMWRTRAFLKYYFVTGVGAGLLTMAVSLLPFAVTAPLYHSLTVGASGAIYGLLLAYGLAFPDRPIFIYAIFPIPAKYLVMIFGAIAFLSSMSDVGGSTSHLAHLGGLVIGYLYLRGGRINPVGELKYQVLEMEDREDAQALRRLLRRATATGTAACTEELFSQAPRQSLPPHRERQERAHDRQAVPAGQERRPEDGAAGHVEVDHHEESERGDQARRHAEDQRDTCAQLANDDEPGKELDAGNRNGAEIPARRRYTVAQIGGEALGQGVRVEKPADLGGALSDQEHADQNAEHRQSATLRARSACFRRRLCHRHLRSRAVVPSRQSPPALGAGAVPVSVRVARPSASTTRRACSAARSNFPPSTASRTPGIVLTPYPV